MSKVRWESCTGASADAWPAAPGLPRLIQRDLLAKCRGAVLLNAGRGATLEESALPEALEQGWLHGAALDAFEVEPLPAGSPLWTVDRARGY